MSHKKQKGVASLEFAFMFVIVFMLFYGLIGYSIPLLLGAAYQQLSAEALKVALHHSDIYMVTSENSSTVNHEGVRKVIEESWLPAQWASTCTGYADSYLKIAGNQWSLCIRNNNPEAILPAFSIFGWQVPTLPDEIRGEARVYIR